MRLIAKAVGRETGKDRRSMKAERTTSSARFNNGSFFLRMDTASACIVADIDKTVDV